MRKAILILYSTALVVMILLPIGLCVVLYMILEGTDYNDSNFNQFRHVYIESQPINLIILGLMTVMLIFV